MNPWALAASVVGVFVMVLLGALLFLRRVWFFRDPARTPPPDPDLVISPADGKVIYIRRVQGGEVRSEKLGRSIRVAELTHDAGAGEADPARVRSAGGFTAGRMLDGWLLGIYMSPLDVHYNYAPVDGSIDRVVHSQAARNWPMVDLWEYVNLTFLRRAMDLFGHRFHLENERNTIFLTSEPPSALVRLALVEIADMYVNKIDCFVSPGQRVRRGEKLSFIRRGSQVDVYFDATDVEFLVRVGDQVHGALTPIARVR